MYITNYFQEGNGSFYLEEVMKDNVKFKVTKTMACMANTSAYLLLGGLLAGACGVMIIGTKMLWFGVTL